MSQASPDWRDVSFAFIGDPKLRSIIEDYYKEALAASEAQRPIAAVILCGSVLEGILTFGLKARIEEASDTYKVWRKKTRRFADWSLEEKVEVARMMGLIGEGPAKGAVAVRDFRNLIHPEKVLRRSKPRWPALAQLAIAAVVDVSSSLRGRMTT
jgi:hypothetical protein